MLTRRYTVQTAVRSYKHTYIEISREIKILPASGFGPTTFVSCVFVQLLRLSNKILSTCGSQYSWDTLELSLKQLSWSPQTSPRVCSTNIVINCFTNSPALPRQMTRPNLWPLFSGLFMPETPSWHSSRRTPSRSSPLERRPSKRFVGSANSSV